MRIVHVTAPAPFGGLERVVCGLASEQVARGHDVRVLMTLTPGTPTPVWAPGLERAGVRVETLSIAGRAYFAERRAIRRHLVDHRAEVVHTHGYRSDVLARGVAHALRLPVVSTAHGFASVRSGRSLNERLQLLFWRGFDAVAAVSVPLRDALEQAGVPAARLVVIRNGLVPTPGLLSRTAARAQLGVPADAVTIGWVGRMSEEKAPVLAVEALAELAMPSVHLEMIGDGPLRGAVLARAAELGLGDLVHANGPRGDAAELLPAFDALLLSSHTEGTPMVILEAAMAGVPIVSTAVGGVPDVVGADALTVPPKDASALANALRNALSLPQEAAARAGRLRERLKASAATDDWVGQYLALYDRVIARRRA